MNTKTQYLIVIISCVVIALIIYLTIPGTERYTWYPTYTWILLILATFVMGALAMLQIFLESRKTEIENFETSEQIGVDGKKRNKIWLVITSLVLVICLTIVLVLTIGFDFAKGILWMLIIVTYVALLAKVLVGKKK